MLIIPLRKNNFKGRLKRVLKKQVWYSAIVCINLEN